MKEDIEEYKNYILSLEREINFLKSFPSWKTISGEPNYLSWKTIEKAGESLAINSKGEFLIGYLGCKEKEKGIWFCENHNNFLSDVIAYISVSELINSFKK